jgi:ATP-dependent DNA helicase DinG
LQDQLFKRDIPNVRAALKVPVTIALLKGRANYICHYHLERSLQDMYLSFINRDEIQYLQQIERYANTSKGVIKVDLARCQRMPSGNRSHQRVTIAWVPGPDYKKCFDGSITAPQADVVVVNHHLFFADVMLRDEGLSELLPACNTVIFDEAHQLPETASLFFGESISTNQMLDLARDAKMESLQAAGDFIELPNAIAAME